MARYAKGTSGNLAGKPKGTKDKRTELRELLRPHAEQLVKKAVAMALDGDSTALRLCIDRLIPSVKAVSLPVQSDVATTGSLIEQMQSIYQAAVAGKIGTDEAAALVTTLSAQARIQELTDHEIRIAELEALLPGGTK